MTPNDKLPEDIRVQIWSEAKAYAKKHGRKEVGYYSLNYEAGATAWAPWFVKHSAIESELHGVRAENERFKKEAEQLRQWKKEATELLAPILDYGQGRAPLGKSITEFVLKRVKKYDELKDQARRMADALEEIADSNCDYESTGYVKSKHSTECNACKAKTALQQFKDGGKEVENG